MEDVPSEVRRGALGYTKSLMTKYKRGPHLFSKYWIFGIHTAQKKIRSVLHVDRKNLILGQSPSGFLS